MNKLKLLAKITVVFCLAAVLFISCSDDDSPRASKKINKIEIWKTEAGQANLYAYISMSYDNKGKLNRVSGDNVKGEPLMDIFYTYPNEDEFEYIYSVNNSASVRINGNLENGRVYTCKFTNESEVINYSYDNGGYLKKSEGQNIRLEYGWKDGNLISIKASDWVYKREYKPTSISNDYGFDLNILPQLIAGEDFMEAVNTYCWMAGILGKKSKNLVEETIYTYSYMYDDKGRLTEITLSKNMTAKLEAYSFRLAYEDNK